MKHLFLLLLVFSLIACSEKTEQSGTGSNADETEMAHVIWVKPAQEIATNNSDVPLVDTAPSVEMDYKFNNGRARLWKLEETAEIIWEDSLKKNGQLEIPSQFSGFHYLEIYTDLVGAGKYLYLNEKENSIELNFYKKREGTVSKNGAPVANAKVKILSEETTTDANGVFKLERIPTGVQQVYIEYENAVKVFQVFDGKSNFEMASAPRILVENFENWETRRTLLGQTFGEGWWYNSSDTVQEMYSKVIPNLWNDSVLEYDENGKFLHVNFELDTSTTAFALVGFSLGDDFYEDELPAFFDLQSMTAITFKAKGSGNLNLQLVQKNSANEREFLSAPFTLGPDYQTFTIEAHEFGNTPLTNINAINFMATENAELYLDDITIEGISIAEWARLAQ